MDTDSKVKLAEIGGDIKRIFDFITRQGQDVNRIDTRLNHHGERLTALEAAKNQAVGAALAVKLLYASGGVVVTGAVALIARSQGV